jgi:formylmethanofuran dehydrogenase subunit C
MAELTLTPKDLPTVPLEVEISPDSIAGKSLEDIKKIKIMKGNREKELADFFDVKGSSSENPAENKIIINGNVDRVKGIGAKMTAGEILIKGNAGMHTGDGMKGGKLTIEGDCAEFCAMEIKGGEFEVKGNAGNYLAGAQRGTWRGSSKGKVTVHGNCGVETAGWMKGKTIVINIKGNAAPYLGAHMALGTIIVDGDADRRVGTEMSGGKIIVNGKLTEISPSFSYVGDVNEIELSETDKISGNYLKFEGDFATISVKSKKKGELYLSKDKNKNLIPK